MPTVASGRHRSRWAHSCQSLSRSCLSSTCGRPDPPQSLNRASNASYLRVPSLLPLQHAFTYVNPAAGWRSRGVTCTGSCRVVSGTCFHIRIHDLARRKEGNGATSHPRFRMLYNLISVIELRHVTGIHSSPIYHASVPE